MNCLVSPLRPDCATSALVEHRMQLWLALQASADQPALQRQAARRVAAHISISRQAGTGAEGIARRVGQRLYWSVLDKELVDTLAARYHWPRAVLELLDETSSGSLSGAIATWLDHTHISQEKFVHCLVNTMREAAQRGNVVIVGRGAACALHDQTGLRVRIIAPLQFRVERFMQMHGVSYSEARRIVAQTDRNRQEFAQRYFHRHLSDHRLYDLVIDVEKLGDDGAADQIVNAAHVLF